MNYIIYSARNTVTGDEYVGATRQDLRARQLKHFSDAELGKLGCRYFNAAIRKYGRGAFEWSVIGDFGEDADLAEIGEIEFIAKRNPVYNILPGGKGFKRSEKTPEHIEKIAAKLRGRKRTPEQLERFRQVRANPTYRAHQAAKSSRAVICVTTGMRFNSARDAAAYFGVSGALISGAARGALKTAAGMVFKYENGVGK